MNGYSFAVPGSPQPWRRARRAGRRTFTDPKSAAFKDRVAVLAMNSGVRPLKGPVVLVVVCYWPSRKPDLKRGTRPMEWRASIPDADNCLKAASDALNGIAYTDDGQVVVAAAFKIRAEQGEPPRVEIHVREAPDVALALDWLGGLTGSAIRQETA